MTDRLWDKSVQEFIQACKHEQLRDVRLGYTVLDDTRKILNVTATYASRKRGPVSVGYRWAETKQGWLPEVFVDLHTAPAGLPAAPRILAWKSRLWRERAGVRTALEAVSLIFFKATAVRNDLGTMLTSRSPESSEVVLEQGHLLTLQTLNDLAFIYSGDQAASQRP
ncbi:hypothetical protein [Pseudarthrobacter chlorophenolicus]|uniref:hypothetical protein n=1 Tax=Pseudarthrobacter chlorophenolicus TaxID=85085 RepID=UPI001113C0F9|nr:hypothetical protein [Pseudarthrobacter chlorophenolicus]